MPVDPTEVAFNELVPELPLALLPVRLETRFLPVTRPTELVIRVFPDEIHTDRHDPTLTETEIELARVYWETVWRAATDEAAVTATREWLSAQLGPFRASYVARASKPTNGIEAPSEPVPSGQPLDPQPALNEVEIRTHPSPGVARLLPEYWVAMAIVDGQEYGPFFSGPVTDNLAAAPALVELPDDGGIDEMLSAQGLDWMVDLAAADNDGMTIHIDLTRLPAAVADPSAATAIDELIVFGARRGEDYNTALRDLLEAHRWTRGLDLVPQGTPTNNTDDVRSGISPSNPDLDLLFDAETGDRPTASRAFVLHPKRIYDETAGDAASIALGIFDFNVLDRIEHAANAESSRQRAMNQALWPGTISHYLEHPLGPPGDQVSFLGESTVWLAEWFIDFVRGGALLPTLRVGTQPYGLLPVATLTENRGDLERDRLEDLLTRWSSIWSASTDSVARLDSDSGDVIPGAEAAAAAANVAAVLGACPNPTALRLREASNDVDDYQARYDFLFWTVELLAMAAPDENGDYYPPDAMDSNFAYNEFTSFEPQIVAAATVADQIGAWNDLATNLRALRGTAEQETAWSALAEVIDGGAGLASDGAIVGLLRVHSARVEPVHADLEMLGANDKLTSDAAPPLYTTVFGEEGSETPVDLLVAGNDASGAGEVLSEVLRSAIAEAAALAGGTPRQWHFDDPKPLFTHLVNWSIASVRAGHHDGLVEGFTRLREILESAEVEDPVAEIERLFRETLGLASYRLDAWITSLAAELLGQKRVARRTGLQVGAYGWVLNLKPRPQGQEISQGFIHAPSLDHAATAAVLRSGWSAFGTEDAGTPLAVNLSSDRVRRGRWIADGIRSGWPLDRLLGQRLERRLHDAGLDYAIDDLRADVLVGTGAGGRPPTVTVDGLILASAFLDGNERGVTEIAVHDAVAAGVLAQVPELEAHLTDLAADLDAVADLVMAQAVHALVRGNTATAAASLATAGSGQSGVPPMTIVESPRPVQLVTHRVTAIFGHRLAPHPWGDDATRPVAIAEPRLERWLASFLPPPGRVAFRVDGVAGSLAELGMSAIETVIDAPRLTALIAAERGVDIDQVDGSRPPGLPANEVSLDELVVIAASASAVLAQAHPLTASDIPGDSTAPTLTPDVADLEVRLADTLAALDDADPGRNLVSAHETDHESEWSEADPARRAELLAQRLQLATGFDIMILALFTPGNSEELARTFTNRIRRRQAAEHGAGWILQMGRVRRAMGALGSIVQLGESIAGRPLFDFSVAQFPAVAGEGWAALHKPQGDGPRTGLISITAVPPLDQPIAGLVVDAWVDEIPTRTQATGIAFHFDAPGSKPPQAVLLGVTHADENFDRSLVLSLIRQALQLMKVRAVGPETLATMGQFLPAVFLPEEIVVENSS